MPPFLTARWQGLAMLNYEVDPALLRPHVPAGTELDSWEGRTLVSMVGFLFLQTRVCGIPIPFHRDFEEVNLRFYVRRREEGQWRRGVVFLREIVPRRAIAATARALYGERYLALPMRHEVPPTPWRAGQSVCYGWKHQGAWNELSLELAGPRVEPAEDSEAAYITEHYWGYTRQRGGATLAYEVRHPRWLIWPGVRPVLRCHVEALYGPGFVTALQGPPVSSFLAEGSPVEVRWGRRLAGEPNTGGPALF